MTGPPASAGMRDRGKLSLRRVSCSREPDYLALELTDDASRTVVLEVRVPLDRAGDLISGRDVEVPFSVTPDRVGARYEHKTETIALPEGPGPWKRDERETLAAELLRPFEVGGWKGRASDLFNAHTRRTGKDGVQAAAVVFVRWVRPDGEPVP